MRPCKWTRSFPSCVWHWQRPISFLPYPEYWGVLQHCGGVAGRTAGLSEDIKWDTEPTNCNSDFTGKPTHKLPCLRMLPTGKRSAPTFHTPNPYVLSLCSSLPVFTPKGRESTSIWRWLVNKCKKLSWLYRTGRKHTNLIIQHCPTESKQETVTFVLALQDQEKTYKLKNTLQGKIRNEEHPDQQRSEKTSESTTS